mmetsp:Transcript_24714/g.35487  ORF Transcript_24714/g.35487 Transcript_24714/m.35487 type:complete len:697 (-) Transcript_24714:639-2729(-)
MVFRRINQAAFLMGGVCVASFLCRRSYVVMMPTLCPKSGCRGGISMSLSLCCGVFGHSCSHWKNNFRLGNIMRLNGGSLESGVEHINSVRSESNMEQVRNRMLEDGMDALIVPTDDPHMSEYVAPYFSRREFVSGFTGSAGTAVITRTAAALFTDGRYHSQAERELSAEWTLMRSGLEKVPTVQDWLAESLPRGSVVGLDPQVHAAEPAQRMQRRLEECGLSLKMLGPGEHPVDRVWGAARPPLPAGPVRQHPISHAGKTARAKLEEVRALMGARGAGHLLLTALDEVAWLLNLRGSDVACNPVSLCFAVLGLDSLHLFMDGGKLSAGVALQLQEDAGEALSVRPYLHIEEFLRALGPSRVWVDGRTASLALFLAVPEERRLEQRSPVVLLKACKNEGELAGMRACHLRDGAAVAECLAGLEEDLARGLGGDEAGLDRRVTACRALLSPPGSPGAFLEPSFPTIAGVAANGAVIHYRAPEEGSASLGPQDLVLLDSGGQYLDGTTDVTRTFHTGEPSPRQKEMFTRVLKGHMALDRAVFPAGTPGCLLDSLARTALWEVGLNYPHGTGHGVGAALNVHEGPQRISPLPDSQPLLPGMVVSNEPGFYEPGAFGIRIENLLEVVQEDRLDTFQGRGFLGFRRLTHIPIQKKLLQRDLLTHTELAWLDSYHKQVWDRVGPLLKTDRARRWLRDATDPLL